MMSRNAVLACLVALELAVAGEIVASVRAFAPGPPSLASERPARDGSRESLVEDGPPRHFSATARPVLFVDIGYADLTLRAGDASAFDVSVAASASHGWLRSKGPIAVRAEGDALHVTGRTEPWSSGDDRMVTVVVPPQARIVVRDAGNIEAAGLRADTSLHSLARGTVTVEDYDAGRLHVAATDGPVTLNGVDAARLDVSTGDGRIRARALRVRDGKIESEDGAVALAFAPGSDTSVAARTDGGAVRVAGTGAAADATGRLRLGAGEGRLDVRASDDIELTP